MRINPAPAVFHVNREGGSHEIVVQVAQVRAIADLVHGVLSLRGYELLGFGEADEGVAVEHYVVVSYLKISTGVVVLEGFKVTNYRLSEC